MVDAISKNVNLSYADLRYANFNSANLSNVNLSYADLRDANFNSANLSDTDFRYADLSDANISGANLSYADLSHAYLSDADLSGTNFRYADLSDANISGANLSNADLSVANLSNANLSNANLIGANLTDANLSGAKSDFFEILLRSSKEIAGLRKSLVDGKVDGSVYKGECACLIGTIANIRKCNYENLGTGLIPNSSRPAESWFCGIKEGDTPDTNQISAITVEWLDEFVELLKMAKS